MDLQKNHQYKQLKGPTIRPSKKLKKTPQQNKNTNTKKKNLKMKMKKHQNELENNANGKILENQKENKNEERLETQILKK